MWVGVFFPMGTQVCYFSYGVGAVEAIPAVVRKDMAAVCKYCVVIAVTVSAIFLSSQQADDQ